MINALDLKYCTQHAAIGLHSADLPDNIQWLRGATYKVQTTDYM